MVWLKPLIKGEMMDCHIYLDTLLKNKTFHFIKKANILKDGAAKATNKRRSDGLPYLAGHVV